MRHPLLKHRLLCGWLLLAVGANAAAASIDSGRAFPRARMRAAAPAAACPDGTILGAGCLEFIVALDLDNNADTGCLFTTEGLQRLSGFEELLTTTVDVRFNPPQVVAVTASSCGNEGSSPVAVPFAPPWAVGVGNGIGGANVVETYLPLTAALAGLRRSDTYRIVVTSDAVAGDAVPDDLLTTTGQASGSPILFQLPAVLIPTLGEWGALLLVMLLAAAALLRLRRRGARVLAGVLLLSLGIGAAWAIIPDGAVSDWVGIEPLAVNPSPNPAAAAGLVAVFAKLEGSLLFLRIDSRFLTLPVAVADAYTTPLNTPLIVAAPGVLQNDQGEGLTATLAGGPAHGTLTLRTNGGFTYQAAAGFTGADSFSYTAANNLGTSSPATVTLAVGTPPAVQSTVPANGATGVPANSSVTINFNQPVNLTTAPSAFKLECPAGSPVPFTVTPAPPGGVASFVLHPAGPLPGGLCAVTVLAAQVTDLAAGQHPTADFVFSFTSAPPLVANADRYPETVIGNVSVSSAAIGFSVIRNDVFTGPVTISAFDRVSAGGGEVTMITSGPRVGMFTYNPPAGFQGIDSFTYTLAGAGGSSTATVSLPVANMIWFIQGGAPAGDGRLSSPFNDLAAFQAINDGAARHPAAGDHIFLFDSAAAYRGPVSLLASQRLVGQDASASVAGITGLNPGASSAPLPTTGVGSRNPVRIISSANGINLNRDNQVWGLTLGDARGVAIAGSKVRSLVLQDLSIATTGAAIDVSGGALEAVLTAVSAGGGTHGIALANVTGSFEVTGDGPSDPADPTRGRTTAKQGGGALALGSGGTIAGAAGAGVSLDHAGSSITLRNMTLSGNGGDGLTAANVLNLTLDNVLIDGQAANHGLHGTAIDFLTMIHTEVSGNGTAAGAAPPGVENVRLDHLTGTSSVTGSLIANSLGALFQIVESGADAMTLTVANSGFQDSQGEGEGLAVAATDDANVTLTVTGSTFLRHSLNAIHYDGEGSSGGGRISITGSIFDLNRADINLFHAGAGKTLDATVDGNTTRQTAAGPHDSSILLKLGAAPGAVLRGTITANQVGSSTLGSAADLGPGICALASGSGAMIATIDGNTVRQTSSAIFVGSSEETGGTIDVTITRNDLSLSAPAGDSFGIELRAGSLPTDTGLLCANMTGNIAVIGNLSGIQIDTVPGTTVELQGYNGAANDHAAIDAFLGTTATTVAPPAAIPTIQGTIKPAAAPCPVPP